jgi:ABC-type multidrug transport system fused ATPase/permease subunit
VPSGPGYDNPEFQGCAFTGAELGSLEGESLTFPDLIAAYTKMSSVPGSRYLGTAFQYTRSNLWRNFGVVIAFTVLYILVTVFATEFFDFTSGGGGALEFKKSKVAKKQVKGTSAPNDEEKVIAQGDQVSSSETLGAQGQTSEETMAEISGSDSIFTWENVEYSVPYMGEQKTLLNKVSGYAKPGLMVALMGASGAGKTTLLNTLSQR